jgi:hypothetical protein
MEDASGTFFVFLGAIWKKKAPSKKS